MSHFTLAVSQGALAKALDVLRASFRAGYVQTVTRGPLTVTYDVAFHLEQGTLELNGDGSLRIKELDLKWDRLQVRLDLDIPEQRIGGFTLFGRHPDLSLQLDLGSSVHTEVSVTAQPETEYFVNPDRRPDETDHAARANGHPNQWRIYLRPTRVDFDLFDIADTAADILQEALERALAGAMAALPDWAVSGLRGLLGSAIEVLRLVLDLGDDLSEWLSRLLTDDSTGLVNQLAEAIAAHYAESHPYKLEDPVRLLPATSAGLIPVLVPIRNLTVRMAADEMVLEADAEG